MKNFFLASCFVLSGILSLRVEASGDSQVVKLKIGGMTCGSCASKVQKAIRHSPGTSKIEVSLGAKEAVFVCSKDERGTCNEAEIIKKIQDLGYTAQR